MTKWRRSQTVMGIDPSLTGFAMASAKKGDDFADIMEVVSKPLGKTADRRLARYEQFLDVIMDHVNDVRPSLVLIEGYSFASVHKAHELGEFGILIRQALLRTTTLIEVQPSALKKFATGKGNSKKAGVVSAIASRYGLVFQTDNEADAYALLQMALQMKGWEDSRTKFQAEAVASLTKKKGK